MGKGLIKILAFFVVFVMPFYSLNAAMQSSSYVIYENVMHSFDGPVISNVASSVSGITPTITWDTNVEADSFVVYDTDSSFTTSKEQGYSAKTSSSHSVSLSGLEENTLYYYRVRSERVNGGLSTSPTGTFTNGSETVITPGDEGEESVPQSGGMLIIDKRDKIPPVITNVQVNVLNDSSVEISWETDEEATSFVEYGRTKDYGGTYGQWASTTLHVVTLDNLIPGAGYHFRVLSSDDWGNLSYSEDFVFTTEDGIIVDEELIEEIDEEVVEEEPEIDQESLLALASARALEFLRRLFPEVSLNQIGPNNLFDINSLDELSNFVPAPILSGEPRVEIGATEVKIYWTTDIDSSSLVAMAPDSVYSPEATEPYQQIVGNSEERVTIHEVALYNLSPDTTYHFQLRSRADIGPLASSRDFTFTTSAEELEITSFFSQVISNEKAVFKWVTNKESDSSVRYAPFHGNVLAIDESKTVKDNSLSVIHEIELNDLQAGVFYDVEIISVDANGNIVSEKFDHFSTSEDDLPPVISYIKADSTVFVDRSSKIQTIITWMTNEPSTSNVYFQEGVYGSEAKLAESTGLNTNYTKEHVMVITKFKPGVVYSFRVESIDSGGNTTLSKPHTFMTAKKKESIIQIIINILENTFGWVKDLM